MLDTGFDCPEVVNLVMARFTHSGVLYRQMRGRGTRKADHIRKAGFTMFDFVGNCDFHDDEEPLEGSAMVAQPAVQTPTKPRRLLTLDIHDEIDPTTREWVVYEADGTVRPSSAEEVRSERLGVRMEAFLAGESLNAEQTRLAGMVAAQIKAHAADMTAFSLARFTRPPFSLRGGLDAALAAFGSEAALRAFLARLNAAVFAPEPPPTDSGDHQHSPH
jgi:type I restriction enzyme R subunit